MELEEGPEPVAAVVEEEASAAAAAEARPVREVTGTEKSLLDCLKEGIVPRPPLVGQREWLTWRTKHGKRPALKRTGELGTSLSREMTFVEAGDGAVLWGVAGSSRRS